jgi:hypothetical protein
MPIPPRDEAGFPIIQYANNTITILVMKASHKELLCLKVLLESFAQSMGLRVNYAKSYRVPPNMTDDDDKVELLVRVFDYKIQGMTFTYHGLPMGTTKPRIEHYAPLMNRVERQLTSISSMITHASKL